MFNFMKNVGNLIPGMGMWQPKQESTKIVQGGLSNLVSSVPWNFQKDYFKIPYGQISLGDQLFLKKVLSDGSYGVVYDADLEENNMKKPVAVKIYKDGSTTISEDMILELTNNLMMMQLCTTSVTCVHSAFRVNFSGSPNPKEYYFGLIMERMDADLRTLASNVGFLENLLDEQRLMFLIFVAIHIFSIVKEIHALEFAHNDIKPQNFLYRKVPQSPYVEIKIGDFGIGCAKNPEVINGVHAKIQNEYNAITKDPTVTVQKAEIQCSYKSTEFYRLSEYDNHPDFGPVPNFETALRNDYHCLAMSIKDLFFACRFTKHQSSQWVNAAYKKIEPDYSAPKAIIENNLPAVYVVHFELQPIAREFSAVIQELQYSRISISDAITRVSKCYKQFEEKGVILP